MPISDVTMDTIYQAMHGLAARQRIIADNIANIQTPGFQAGRVDFETSLRQAVGVGDPNATSVGVSKSSDPSRQDGNNVNLDDETLSMTDTNLRYQTMVEAMNTKFRLLRDAMNGPN
jgi:flagellar basal-body rod protein FlgB